MVTCTVGRDLTTFDLREENAVNVIEGADAYGVTCGDYNPNRPHVFVSGGEDGLVKIWDFRSPSPPPLLTLLSHTHHLTSVSYNRFHDQLLSTSGTDGKTHLWRVGSVSSAPLLELDDDEFQKGASDKLVQSSVDQESGCVGIAWSKCDAWVYAGVEWDGSVIANSRLTKMHQAASEVPPLRNTAVGRT